MLKIKENVDLKELKKFGFYKPTKEGYVWQLNLEVDNESIKPITANMFILSFLETDRILEMSTPNGGYNTYKLDVLYDLIKADLLEKV